MRFLVRNRHFFAVDFVLLAVSAYLSFVLRLGGADLTGYWEGLVLFSATSLVVVPVVFRFAGVYSRYWRFASVEEVLLLSMSISIATLIVTAIAFSLDILLSPQTDIPRSIPFIFLLLGLVVTAGPRLAVRLARMPRAQGNLVGGRQKVLIMGAGRAGEIMLRELRHMPHLNMQAVGFLDDDPSKLSVRIHGVPVLGSRSDIAYLAAKHDVQMVIIAMPTTSGKVIREIVQICEQAGVQARTMPGLFELLSGTVSVNQLRNVQIEDLLRRAPTEIDMEAVAKVVHGKRVLITGGGGSIGRELCRLLLHYEPSELIVLGHGENSVFEIHQELQRLAESHKSVQQPKISTVICDIRFKERVHQVFDHYRPQLVFHAAAHKHVPLMEQNPEEAVTNNVLGTRSVIDASLAVDVERFVMISSDKAVNPTNIMGVSKRTAELLVHRAADRSGKPYMAVRFGNVLGSRGSVVLAFKQQIAAGGPITITDPRMERYFMTIPEAVTLVLQAAVLGKGGEVFVLDMGEPVKIVDLASDMIRLSGLLVGHDIDIVYTGMRPGEKLFEELFVDGEQYERTSHAKIFHVANASSFVPQRLDEGVEALTSAASRHDGAAIRRVFQQIVPEYRPVREASRDEPPSGGAAGQKVSTVQTGQSDAYAHRQPATG
jgi:FlaA1/EpsC-like NDP-sugar epimerase